MSEWEKLQKKHPAIEPRPISTISGEIPEKSQRVADGLQEVADAPAENRQNNTKSMGRYINEIFLFVGMAFAYSNDQAV